MNERACIEEHLIDANPEAVFFDGLDDAIIGMAYRYNDDPLVAYSQKRIIEILSRDMEFEDAVEYFDFNIACLWAGEGTPVIVDDSM